MPGFEHERVMPDEADGQYIIHKVRYRFAAQHAKGRRVLDAGCGAGYGAAMLAQAGGRVTAIDADAGIVDWARQRYGTTGLDFAAMDVQRLAFAGDRFDLVVSLQVMEHIPDTAAYLSELYRVLAPGGELILSTENEEVHHLHLDTAGIPDADSHVNVMDRARFRREIERHFTKVRYLCQRPRGHWLHTVLKMLDPFNLRLRFTRPVRREKMLAAMGMPVKALPSMDDYVISPWLIRQAPIQIAVCTK